MSAPKMLHYTYPHVHHICIGCQATMHYEIVVPVPLLKLVVECHNENCPFYQQKFEVLPTLLKPYVDEAKEELISRIYTQ